MRTLPAGAVVGARYGARNVRGVRQREAGGRMRTLPLEPSVELPMGHQTREGCAKVRRGRMRTRRTGALVGAPHEARNA